MSVQMQQVMKLKHTQPTIIMFVFKNVPFHILHICQQKHVLTSVLTPIITMSKTTDAIYVPYFVLHVPLQLCVQVVFQITIFKMEPVLLNVLLIIMLIMQR